MSLALCGISSLTWTPGTLVGMLRKGPPNSESGFGSQLSNWLMPPSSQMKITWRFCFFISAATACCIRPDMPHAPTAAVPARVPSICRRERAWSAEPHSYQRFMVSVGTGGQ